MILYATVAMSIVVVVFGTAAFAPAILEFIQRKENK